MRRLCCFLLLAFLQVPFGRVRGGDSDGAVADRDSIESVVRWLTTDPSSGELRTRFVLREEPLAMVADSLASRLSRATGNPARIMEFSFDRQYDAPDSTYRAENIVALLPGTGEVSGAFVVSAHFDAIASRTVGWTENWESWPAPGADDDATGVAAVLEVAREFGERAEALPFDLLFVLFSGEEFDRLGSIDFVARLPEAYGERVIGAINFDMLGYRPGASPAASLLSNPASGWLSDCIVDHARFAPEGLPLEVSVLGPTVSDHQSFWEAGIPAVTIMEPLLDGRVAYPYYHSVLDTLGRVDIEQTGRIVDLAVGFLDSLGAAPAEIAMLPSDLLLYFRGYPTTRRVFTAGDTLEVVVRARNVGSAAPPPGSTARVALSLQTSAGSSLLHESATAAPGALESADVVVTLALGPEHAGANVLRSSIGVLGMENDELNDATSLQFAVESAGQAVLMHSMQPNPMQGPFAAGSFCMNLARAVDAHLEIFTLEGERLEAAYLGERWGTPLSAGLVCVPLGGLFPGVDELASGIYLYRLVVFDGAAQTMLNGRFAIER